MCWECAGGPGFYLNTKVNKINLQEACRAKTVCGVLAGWREEPSKQTLHADVVGQKRRYGGWNRTGFRERIVKMSRMGQGKSVLNTHVMAA